ncbi:uridine kinase family protein [Goodfellowiella coeruleoviolacea]
MSVRTGAADCPPGPRHAWLVAGSHGEPAGSVAVTGSVAPAESGDAAVPVDVVGLVADAVLAAPARLGRVRVLAVDGPSGSGKSTLAGLVAAELRGRAVATVLVPTDHFATWDDPVAWWPRLVNGVLRPLAAGRPGRYQRVEWPGGLPRLGEWVAVPVPRVLVIEGVSAARAAGAALLSRSVWVELADPDLRLARAVARDGENSREHLRRWQEFERGWFAVDRTPDRADLRLVPRDRGASTGVD